MFLFYGDILMKKNFHRFIFLCLLAGSFFPVYADGTYSRGITLDGTIGTAEKLDLPGPNYEIKPEHGHQAGANLFHSFQKFNIHSNESATFSGPNSVQNIISRVTGGNASWIDGTLRSTIPGADMYLLNPAGMMFGANARLDLGGSFHVSTADYLRLGENDRFYAMPQGNDVLSIAAPTAFGFLDGDAGVVSVEGKGELTTEVWGSAGDITLETENLELRENASVSSASKFLGKGGDAGTISIHATETETVRMTGNTSVNTSSEGQGDAGDITFTAANLNLDNGAVISSASNADQSGGAAGEISGEVTLPGGKSVLNALVNARMEAPETYAETMTDEAGHFTLTDLIDGTWIIFAEPPERETHKIFAESSEVVAEITETVPTVALLTATGKLKLIAE